MKIVFDKDDSEFDRHLAYVLVNKKKGDPAFLFYENEAILCLPFGSYTLLTKDSREAMEKAFWKLNNTNNVLKKKLADSENEKLKLVRELAMGISKSFLIESLKKENEALVDKLVQIERRLEELKGNDDKLDEMIYALEGLKNYGV